MYFFSSCTSFVTLVSNPFSPNCKSAFTQFPVNLIFLPIFGGGGTNFMASI